MDKLQECLLNRRYSQESENPHKFLWFCVYALMYYAMTKLAFTLAIKICT